MENGGNLENRIEEFKSKANEYTPIEAYAIGREDMRREFEQKQRDDNELKDKPKNKAIRNVLISIGVVFLVAGFIAFNKEEDSDFVKLLVIVEIFLLTFIVWNFAKYKEVFGDKLIPLVGVGAAVLFALGVFTGSELWAALMKKIGLDNTTATTTNQQSPALTNSHDLSRIDSLRIAEIINAQKINEERSRSNKK